MMVESIFALIKNGKLCVRKTLMEDGMSVRLMSSADCSATQIMVIIIAQLFIALMYTLSDELQH